MVIGLLGLAALLGPARAEAQTPASPSALCRGAIRQAEAGSGLPSNLLSGIARVESGRRDPATGQFGPWPWTINAEGRGSFFETKAEAIAFANALRARGVQSFDVGCLQINMLHHPDAFASLEEAFDPVANARYAVRFLQSLKDKLGSWEDAAAWYHSANPELGVPYRGLVMTAMAEEAKLPAAAAAPSLMRLPLAGLPALAPIVAPPALPAGMSSMPSHPGALIMLSRATGPSIGTQGLIGRGLDSYRSQPVAMISFRTLASR